MIDHVGGHREIGRVVAERAAEAHAQLVVVGPATRPGTNADSQGTSLGDLLASAESDVLIAGDDRHQLVASRRPSTLQQRDVASR